MMQAREKVDKVYAIFLQHASKRPLMVANAFFSPSLHGKDDGKRRSQDASMELRPVMR